MVCFLFAKGQPKEMVCENKNTRKTTAFPYEDVEQQKILSKTPRDKKVVHSTMKKVVQDIRKRSRLLSKKNKPREKNKERKNTVELQL
jgi:hypothetical protein